MKLLALDIGDVWIGSAISDALGILARPFKTVTLDDLEKFVIAIVPEENISTIVVGLPKTMSGTESEQTIKTRCYVDELRENIAKTLDHPVELRWWDERRSRKLAQQAMKTSHKKSVKQDEHSFAAAIILQGYLDLSAFLASTK